MYDVIISFNGQDYTATYNNGYYEVSTTAPSEPGLYTATITATDDFGLTQTQTAGVIVYLKPQIELDQTKVFMWIFSHSDFSVVDIVELSNYEICIDEELNAKSTVNILKATNAVADDVVAIRKNGQTIYWGIIDEIHNDDGKLVNTYSLSYITNLFNRKIVLENESIIRNTGVEDFIYDAIYNNWINNSDTFINLSWLNIVVETHTPKQTSVTNVENGIYNLHTWITNCTQNYDITYSFEIIGGALTMTIEEKSADTILIDTTAQNISNYNEVFETDVVSKVSVLYSKVAGADSSGVYNLYLLNDRTTTTNQADENRAEGKITTVYTENYEDANQTALNEMKANLYNHNITFWYDNLIEIGTPVSIKTKKSIVYNTYISAIKMTSKKFYEYQCGNIRVKFINKLLKEKRNA